MADCTRNIMGSLWTQPSIGSVFWLLVGGLLVGLGAPFWAQAVSNLSASRDVTRKITDIVNPQSMSASPGTRGFSAGPGAKSTPFAAFDLASAAQGLKNTPAVPGTAPPPPPLPPVKP